MSRYIRLRIGGDLPAYLDAEFKAQLMLAAGPGSTLHNPAEAEAGDARTIEEVLDRGNIHVQGHTNRLPAVSFTGLEAIRPTTPAPNMVNALAQRDLVEGSTYGQVILPSERDAWLMVQEPGAFRFDRLRVLMTWLREHKLSYVREIIHELLYGFTDLLPAVDVSWYTPELGTGNYWRIDGAEFFPNPATTKAPKLPPFRQVLRLRYWAQECTYELNNDYEHRKHISQMWAVYVIDLNEVTHLCELTPSYAAHFCEYMYTGPLWDGTVELDDDQEALRDEIETEMNGCGVEDVHYYHCSYIDRLCKGGGGHVQEEVEVLECIDDWSQERDEKMDDARQQYTEGGVGLEPWAGSS